MKKMLSMLAVLAAVTMFFASCDKPPKEDETIPVTEIKITPENPSLVNGESLTLKAEVLPENATNKKVTWGSRDKNTVKIDSETGVITGAAVGTAEVWARAGEVVKSVNVQVTAAPIRVESVTLSKTELALFAGKKEQLFATTTPAAVTYPEQKWASSDEAVATVDGSGVVTAVAEGSADITVTIDEKTATCKVSVTIPAVADIATPYLKDLADNTVTMTAAGFKAGDKIKLESLAGEDYTSPELDVKDITNDDAKFDLPADIVKTRSYKLTLLRGGEVAATSYLRPDDQMVRVPFNLGYFLTGSGEIVPDDPNMGLHGTPRRGYAPGKIFELDETTKDFMVWKDDAALVGQLAVREIPTLGNNVGFDFTNVIGVDNLDPLKGLFDMSNIPYVFVSDCALKSLDMTIFPNATHLYAWGTAGITNTIESVNFGTYTDDEHASKLVHIQMERQALKGEIDLRNCIALNNLILDDNQLEKVNLGTAEGNKDTDDRMLKVTAISVKRNPTLREFDISNCGRVRFLWLEGCKIERIRLVNNALGLAYGEEDRPDGWFPYVWIIKNKEDFSITWATEDEAEGRPRHIDVEQWWYRNFSAANKTDNGSKPGFEKWVTNNPVIQAFNDGFTVTDWYYALEDANGVRVKHEHNKENPICPAEEDAE